MLASELAQELQIDPSVMSKRIGVYFQESGNEKPRILSEQSIQQLRQAHELLSNKQTPNFKTAVQMVLGTYAEPLPPASVRMLERRLEALETVQTQMLDNLTQILQHLEKSRTWENMLEQQLGQQDQ